MKKKSTIFRRILWFKNRGKFEIDFFEILQPRRVVSTDRRYNSGLYRSEKCQREIQYESGLELEFIKLLENDQKVLFYWEQPVQITYRKGRRRVTYTPDFGIYLRTREFVIAEIKDLPGMLDHRVQAKTEALMEFCCERGFGLLLTDGRHTAGELLKGKVNRKLEKRLSAALDVNVIRKEQCRQIMSECNANKSELFRTIIRYNLKFKPFPFKLQRGNRNRIFRQVFFGNRKYDELVEERFPTLFRTGS